MCRSATASRWKAPRLSSSTDSASNRYRKTWMISCALSMTISAPQNELALCGNRLHFLSRNYRHTVLVHKTRRRSDSLHADRRLRRSADQPILGDRRRATLLDRTGLLYGRVQLRGFRSVRYRPSAALGVLAGASGLPDFPCPAWNPGIRHPRILRVLPGVRDLHDVD